MFLFTNIVKVERILYYSNIAKVERNGKKINPIYFLTLPRHILYYLNTIDAIKIEILLLKR